MRADAYQDLALSFYREADGLATQDKHEEAQKLFREALDASKRSLHLRPSDPNPAWNMELAARRIREEQQKQKEEDEKKQKDRERSDQISPPGSDQSPPSVALSQKREPARVYQTRVQATITA